MVLLPPAGAPHLSRRHSLRRAHNAPPAAVDRRPRNCAHTHWRKPFTHLGDCLVIRDEDFRGGSTVLLGGGSGQSQGSWRGKGRAAGGEIVKLLGKIVPSPDLTKVEVTLEADCKETQQARKGDKVTVHYGGFLQDGETKLED